MNELNEFITNISYFLLFVLGLKVIVFMSTSHLHHKKQKAFRNNYREEFNPFVSVIVPCFNEEMTLEHCINSLVKQDYKKYEIIIVDDGSTDNTYSLGQDLASKFPEKVSVIKKVNGGKASALNLGIKRAKGSVVVCIDADSIFVQNTVSELIKPLSNNQVYVVGGNVRVINRGRLLNKSQAMEYISGLGLQRRGFAQLSCMPVISGAIGAFRKEKLNEIGGYSSDTLVEDMDITISIQKIGGKVAYNSHAVAYTESPENIKDFLKQRYRWTFGGFQVLKKHKEMLFNRKYGSLGLFGLPYFLIFPWADVLISSLLFVSLIRLATFGNVINFVTFYIGMVTLQAILLTYTLILDKEDKRLALLAGVDSLWYNHLMSYTTVKAGINYLRGTQASWNKLTRLGKNCLPDDTYAVSSISSKSASL